MVIDFSSTIQVIVVDGLRIRYLDTGGNGKPLLLLHGLGGAIESWRYNIAGLLARTEGENGKKRRALDRKMEKRKKADRNGSNRIGDDDSSLRVIALDLPGFGLSSKPKISYTVKFYSNFVAKFAEALRVVVPFAVVGSSLGGHIACELAITHPRLVSNLVMASPPGALPRSFKGTPALKRYVNVLNAKSANEVKDALFAVDHKPVSNAYAKVVYERLALPGAKEAFLSALTGSGNAPRLDDRRLAKIRAPTLVLWGKQDLMIPVKFVEPFVRMKNSRVVLLENCGHRIHAEMAQVFNELVVNFVAEKSGK